MTMSKRPVERLHAAISSHVSISKYDTTPRQALDTLIQAYFNVLSCEPFNAFTFVDDAYKVKFASSRPVEKEIVSISRMAAAYGMAVSDGKPFDDLLSELFMKYGASGKKGQFFTPQKFSEGATRFLPKEYFEDEKEITLMDFTGCGSGSLLLANLAQINEKAPHKMRGLDVGGVDVDAMMCRATAVQIAVNCFIHRVPIGNFNVFHLDIIKDYTSNKRSMFCMRYQEVSNELN